jgi:5-methylcytosine-specific restriction endonuclease McrA
MNTRAKFRNIVLRHTTPDTLPNLISEQKNLCDLCGEPMYGDAVLEHSVPISVFARGPLALEKAVKKCHDPANIRAAHRECNGAKHAKTREEWFARGLNVSAANYQRNKAKGVHLQGFPRHRLGRLIRRAA